MAGDPIRAAADDCPGDDAYARTTVMVHEVIEIPAAMAGKWCEFEAQTSDVWIRFGTTTSVEVDPSVRSSKDANGVLTVNGKESHLYIPAGTSKSKRLQGEWTHFAHESADMNGVLRFGLAQGGFGAD